MGFLPEDKEYFDLFEKLASIAYETAFMFCSSEKTPEEKARGIKELEVAADDVVHKVVFKLNSHQAVPLDDRHDIRPFVHNIDNIPDYLKEASELIFLIGLEYTKELRDFGKLILKAARKIKEGIALLREIDSKNSQVKIPKICHEINTIENEGDELKTKATLEIFDQDATDLKEVKLQMFLLDIINILEKALDQCEDVANFLETFQTKNA